MESRASYNRLQSEDTDHDNLDLESDQDWELELLAPGLHQRSVTVSTRRSYKTLLVAMTTVVATVVGVILVVYFVQQTTAASDYSQEEDSAYWHSVAFEDLDSSIQQTLPLGVAKNVILFLGDGMGPTSVTAGRILAGQMKGRKGEEWKLAFDLFPYTGLSKTYSVDKQVTDSAASGTAYMTGVKTRQGMLGVSAKARRGNCFSSKGNRVESILRWSARLGKSTGVVTTASITDASPASSYAHTPERYWQSDRLIPESERDCEDIAKQLVTRNQDINVLLGGGRAFFVPENFSDPRPNPAANVSSMCRADGRNLIEEWRHEKEGRRVAHRVVFDTDALKEVDASSTDYLLGLFNQYHMDYEVDRDSNVEPSLAEMTEKAIKILQKNSKGFFLMVEGARIDMGHHENRASKSLHDVVSFSNAVDTAVRLTNKEDTLVVVTADHSHTMAIAGFSQRGNAILAKARTEGGQIFSLDKKPYTSILYANGPGYTAPRENIADVDTEDKEYISQSAVPLDRATHGGEDVAIYAQGPQSHLYTGVHEQNYIPVLMAYASCVGPFAEGKKKCADSTSASSDREVPRT